MAKSYAGKDSLKHLISLIKLDLDTKVNTADISTDLSGGSADKVVSEAQGKALQDKLDALPTPGDILTTDTYDKDGDGTIDKAKEADHATNADEATHATNSDEAGHATNADMADEAGHATTAENANKAGDSDKLGGVAASKYVYVGADGKISSDKLPSYVDDVVEGYYFDGLFYTTSEHDIRVNAETGKIYVDITTPTEPVSYRYSGTAYVAIVSSDMVQITNEEIDTLWSETT